MEKNKWKTLSDEKYDCSVTCGQLLENVDFHPIIIVIMNKNPKL